MYRWRRARLAPPLGLAVFFAVRSTGSAAVELAVIAVLFAVGIWSGTIAEHHFGGIDPGPVVSTKCWAC